MGTGQGTRLFAATAGIGLSQEPLGGAAGAPPEDRQGVDEQPGVLHPDARRGDRAVILRRHRWNWFRNERWLSSIGLFRRIV